MMKEGKKKHLFVVENRNCPSIHRCAANKGVPRGYGVPCGVRRELKDLKSQGRNGNEAWV